MIRLAMGDQVVASCETPQTSQLDLCMFTDWPVPFLKKLGATETEVNEGLIALTVYGIIVNNTDTETRAVSIGIRRGNALFTLVTMSLDAGESLQWHQYSGWSKVSS